MSDPIPRDSVVMWIPADLTDHIPSLTTKNMVL
jgi:hypothetical protein